jgi:hypothetical protein
MLIAVLAATAYRALQQGLVDEEWQAFWTGFCIAAGPVIVLLAYLFGKLGFARGTAGANRFGPDPLIVMAEFPVEDTA